MMREAGSIGFGRAAIAGLIALPPLLIFLYYLADHEALLVESVSGAIRDSDVLNQRTWDVALLLAQSCFFAVLAGLIPAGIWASLVAGRRQVMDDAGSRSERGRWVLFLGLAVSAGGGVGYWWFSTSQIVPPGDPSMTGRMVAGTVSILAIALAFWLATATFVRPVMRASVPGSLRLFKY